ncbi:MAG: hypothetical protein JSS60_04730 [Verrucomicrobia bacterium]|nr:hypothetical protein [Verrucomicrobiota bacterium]
MISLPLAALNLENIFDYLVPIGILILYFLMTAGKKKHAPTAHEEEREPTRFERALPPPPPKTVSQPPGPPPVGRRQEVLRSKIEDRKVHSAVEERRFSSSIQERSSDLVSEEMHKHIDIDPAYAIKTGKKVSHARKLLTNKSSVRNAFLLKEILHRPYESDL